MIKSWNWYRYLCHNNNSFASAIFYSYKVFSFSINTVESQVLFTILIYFDIYLSLFIKIEFLFIHYKTFIITPSIYMIIENRNADQQILIKANKTTAGSVFTLQNTNGSLNVLSISDAGIFSTVSQAIVTNSIADSAITGAKLAANSITSDKIAPGTIIESDVGAGTIHIGL